MSAKRKDKTITVKLLCPCGRNLDISIAKNGWWPSLIAVAAASLWNLDHYVEIKLGPTIPGFCPNCRMAHKHATYSEPRPGEERGMFFPTPHRHD